MQNYIQECSLQLTGRKECNRCKMMGTSHKKQIIGQGSSIFSPFILKIFLLYLLARVYHLVNQDFLYNSLLPTCNNRLLS